MTKNRVVQKIEGERKSVEEQQEKNVRYSQDLYALFTDLQGIAAEYVSQLVQLQFWL